MPSLGGAPPLLGTCPLPKGVSSGGAPPPLPGLSALGAGAGLPGGGGAPIPGLPGLPSGGGAPIPGLPGLGAGTGLPSGNAQAEKERMHRRRAATKAIAGFLAHTKNLIFKTAVPREKLEGFALLMQDSGYAIRFRGTLSQPQLNVWHEKEMDKVLKSVSLKQYDNLVITGPPAPSAPSAPPSSFAMGLARLRKFWKKFGEQVVVESVVEAVVDKGGPLLGPLNQKETEINAYIEDWKLLTALYRSKDKIGLKDFNGNANNYKENARRQKAKKVLDSRIQVLETFSNNHLLKIRTIMKRLSSPALKVSIRDLQAAFPNDGTDADPVVFKKVMWALIDKSTVVQDDANLSPMRIDMAPDVESPTPHIPDLQPILPILMSFDWSNGEVLERNDERNGYAGRALKLATLAPPPLPTKKKELKKPDSKKQYAALDSYQFRQLYAALKGVYREVFLKGGFENLNNILQANTGTEAKKACEDVMIYIQSRDITSARESWELCKPHLE